MYSISDFPFSNDQLIYPGVVPTNAGMGIKAKTLVEQYAKSAIKQFEEALITQGIEMTLFSKIPTNRNCTCSADITTVSQEALQIAEQENLAKYTLYQNSDSLTTDTKELVGIPASQIPEVRQELKETNLSSLQQNLQQGERLLDEIEHPEALQYDYSQQESNYTDYTENPYYNTSTNDVDEAYQTQSFGTLGSGEFDISTKSCPICFGTYKTDSYQPFNGKRYVLCGDNYYEKTYYNSRLDKTFHPYQFFIDSFGSVVFKISLPSFFDLIRIQTYSGRNKNNNIQLFFSLNGIDYLELNKDTIKNRLGKNNENLFIKAKNITNQRQSFTHIEILISFARKDIPLFRLAMGKISLPGESPFADIFGSANVCLSPRLKDWISRETIICEKKYGLTWAVESMEKNFTTDRLLFQLGTTLRLCQQHELWNLLNPYETLLNRKGRYLRES